MKHNQNVDVPKNPNKSEENRTVDNKNDVLPVSPATTRRNLNLFSITDGNGDNESSVMRKLASELNVPISTQYELPSDLTSYRNMTRDLIRPVLERYIGTVDQSSMLILGVMPTKISLPDQDYSSIVMLPVISYGNRIVPYNRLALAQLVQYLIAHCDDPSLFSEGNGSQLANVISSSKNNGTNTIKKLVTGMISTISDDRMSNQQGSTSVRQMIQRLAPNIITQLPSLKKMMSGIDVHLKPLRYQLVMDYQYDESMAYDLRAMAQATGTTISIVNPGDILNSHEVQQSLLTMMVTKNNNDTNPTSPSDGDDRTTGMMRNLW